MPRIPTIAATLLLAGCAARSGGDPAAIAAQGSALDGAPVPGEAFTAELASIDGEAISVPDPSGEVVVLELIRSADW